MDNEVILRETAAYFEALEQQEREKSQEDENIEPDAKE